MSDEPENGPTGDGYWAPVFADPRDGDWLMWVEGPMPVRSNFAGWGASIPQSIKFYEKKP